MKNKKSLLVILGTVVLAVVAIFTAWKLSQPGPVAPTAPKQVPAAGETDSWGEFAFVPSFNLKPGAPAAPAPAPAPAPAAAPTGAACGSAYPQGCPTGHVCTNQQCVVPAPASAAAPSTTTTPPINSCQNRCGNYNPVASCQCDSQCVNLGDCCSDYKSLCLVSPTPAPAAPTTTTTTSPLSPASAPTCGDTKPGTPTITSATASTNQVTLRWTKASDPVTHYFVVYGTSPGKDQFGSINIGNKDTTSYTVKSLSGGKTYYFRIAAVNNCMPGSYSNEISARSGGGALTGAAEGFTAVTGTVAVAPTKTTTATATPSAQLPVSGVNTPTVAVGIGGILLLLLGLALVF